MIRSISVLRCLLGPSCGHIAHHYTIPHRIARLLVILCIFKQLSYKFELENVQWQQTWDTVRSFRKSEQGTELQEALVRRTLQLYHIVSDWTGNILLLVIVLSLISFIKKVLCYMNSPWFGFKPLEDICLYQLKLKWYHFICCMT